MTLQLYNGETVLQNTQYERYDHNYKILLLGDSNVGKTSLLHRFIDDTFAPTFVSTVGIDYKTKTLIKDDRKIKLQIWDTAGQERFHAITKAYIRGASGIMIVYDVTDAETFENVSKWVSYVMQFANDDAERLIVGNKCEEGCHKAVQTYKGEQVAQVHIFFIRTSKFLFKLGVIKICALRKVKCS
jgi:Ras-related protein Rab-10